VAEVGFENKVVGFFLKTTEDFGVPKSIVSIYGVLFASSRPLCFGDIEDRLDLSKGSISQGLRLLVGIGAIKAVEVAEDRREFFIPDMELRKLILRFLENRLQVQLATGEERLEQLICAVPATDPRAAEEIKQRLTYLRTWHGKARALLPVAKTFLKLGG
jgi:DNA-binding transcriptional regulator GbsR (MarR family)